jgi:low temperature requirement protein LtrA
LPIVRSKAPGTAVASVEGDSVTAVELFFDLSYVFGFTQVSRLMVEHHSALGVLRGLVVLGLLWWSWTAYSWLSNQAHADEGLVRRGMFIGMTAVFVAALAVPRAYTDETGSLFAPLLFVAAYLVARITHLAVYVKASVGGAEATGEVVRTVCFSVVPSAALLVLGACLGSPWQVWCGLAAVTIEPVIAYLTTWGIKGRIPSAAHFVERHRLVVILALGESTVAVGASAAAIDGPLVVGVLLSMGVVIALWWAYFGKSAGSAERVLAGLEEERRARTAHHGYSYLHFPIVAGIVVSALGIETAMAHVGSGHPLGWFGAATLSGGVALYLAGTSLFAWRVTGAAPLAGLIAAAIVLASLPVLEAVRPLGALAGLAVLLPAVLLLDRIVPAMEGERRAR